MRHHLTLLRPDYVTDEMGSESTVYTAAATCHAQRVTATGRTTDEAGEHFPAFDAEWYIRDAFEVGEDWRVLEAGGYLYEVSAIVPNIAKGYKSLRCRRVNE